MKWFCQKRRVILGVVAIALWLAGPVRGATAGFEARVAGLEATMGRYFRGESLNAMVTRINAEAKAEQAKLERQRAEVDVAAQAVNAKIASANGLRSRLEAMEKKIAVQPDAGDREAVRRFNQLVTEHNALVAECNQVFVRLRGEVEAQNLLARRYEQTAKASVATTNAASERFHQRERDNNAFFADHEDERFSASVNRLLADLCGEERMRRPQPALLARVRAMRRELAAWAVARQKEQSHSLVLVEALLGAEPCWLVLDTGAQTTTLTPELVNALGLWDRLGAEKEMRVAGGGRAMGREFEIPVITVAGATERTVAAASMKMAGVGIDGLLGQSFLGRFNYTIDESRKEKVVLVRKREP